MMTALPPHAVATAVAGASRLVVGAKAGAVFVALGVLCGGAWYVRTIRDAEHTQAETRRVIALEARAFSARG